MLVKVPVPVPSVVVLLDVVGFGEVLQHTPLLVTVAPPSVEMVPPPDAPEEVMEVIEVVVSVGSKAVVVKLTCVPYAVPELFVAYART